MNDLLWIVIIAVSLLFFSIYRKLKKMTPGKQWAILIITNTIVLVACILFLCVSLKAPTKSEEIAKEYISRKVNGGLRVKGTEYNDIRVHITSETTDGNDISINGQYVCVNKQNDKVTGTFYLLVENKGDDHFSVKEHILSDPRYVAPVG